MNCLFIAYSNFIFSHSGKQNINCLYNTNKHYFKNNNFEKKNVKCNQETLFEQDWSNLITIIKQSLETFSKKKENIQKQ